MAGYMARENSFLGTTWAVNDCHKKKPGKLGIMTTLSHSFGGKGFLPPSSNCT